MDGQWFPFRKSSASQVWIRAVCGSIFSAGDSPFCVGMQTGTSAEDLLIVKAVAPGHKELATIQVFNLWTNAGNKNALQHCSRQFTDEQVATLVSDMITGSEGNAWMMLRSMLKKSALLANPMDAASKFSS
eukprot:6766529-Karenia_brevis.AAC.1